MITRRATEAEFKRLTTDEYLLGGYGLEREQAEELAALEWEIRQEVENTKPHSARIKSSNSRPGFGKNAILIKREKTAAVGRPQEHKEFRVSTDALKALQSKAVLTADDVTAAFSGDAEFLCKYAQSLNFPRFEPRISGYRSWRVYDWIGTYAKRKKIMV